MPGKRHRRVASIVLLSSIYVLWLLRSFSGVSSDNPSVDFRHLGENRCDLQLLIVVLTATRYQSLARLLRSLSSADYGCSTVDLHITIDKVDSVSQEASRASELCLNTSVSFQWSHGRKSIFRRLQHAGLSQSWFESPYQSSVRHGAGYSYLAILEDDMEVSPHFFTLFTYFQELGAFSDPSITAFCLHPEDWEVRVPPTCHGKRGKLSRILYESPEPCNWGPIWKYSEWSTYIDWVFTMKARGELPFVDEDISYNYNKYLSDGKDVQSSWVWRYNFEFGKRQVRYSFNRCLRIRELFLAINHKEPGEHFKKKLDFQNDHDLLNFKLELAVSSLATETSFEPVPFKSFVKGAKSMRGK